ncbi:MAG: hypothetical protein J4F28_08025 [Nitrosopumilaceae archaeon]|nr:hypothetical protein [Nitrosopumilaceae archaeon]
MVPLDKIPGVDWDNPDVDKIFKFFSVEFEKINSRYDKVVQENAEVRSENAELRAQVEELTKLVEQLKKTGNGRRARSYNVRKFKDSQARKNVPEAPRVRAGAAKV